MFLSKHMGNGSWFQEPNVYNNKPCNFLSPTPQTGRISKVCHQVTLALLGRRLQARKSQSYCLISNEMFASWVGLGVGSNARNSCAILPCALPQPPWGQSHPPPPSLINPTDFFSVSVNKKPNTYTSHVGVKRENKSFFDASLQLLPQVMSQGFNKQATKILHK